ncbi:MAG: multi-sensor signal transduction histidine kinase [Firmicutes bacterium]|nr:multi-sensor signal transduction histidine kinase [Bacillota bacterium]
MLRRIYALIIAVLVLAIVASGASSFLIIQAYHNQVNEEYLSNAAALIEQRLLAQDSYETAAKAAIAIYKRGEESIRVTVVEPDGKVVYDSLSTSEQMENHLYRPEIQGALRTGHLGVSIRRSNTLDINMVYLALYSTGLGLVIRTSISNANQMPGYIPLLVTLAIVIGLSLIVLIIIGALSLKKITQPLLELKNAAIQVKQGDYKIRVGSLLADKSELSELSDAFNAMAKQLQTTVHDLEDRNARLDVILNSLVVPLIVVARSRDVVFINLTAQNLFDRHLDPEQAQFPLILITHQAATEELVDECLQNRAAVSREMTITTVRGPLVFQVTASPISYTNSDSAILTFLDISQARQLQRLRSEFVANVTHELRTPLTSIRGFIETLRHGAIDKPDVARRFLDIIDIEAERLHKLISDILVLSEIEDLKSDNERETFNLNALIDDVAVLLDDTAMANKVSIVPETDDETLMVSANSYRLKQVLINLVDNAIKYNREGGRVEIQACRINDQKVELRVSDNGPGIAPEHQERLFERFYRVDTSRSRELGGTGLGLSIVKHIAQLYGGSARVESKLGQGTTFIVELMI